MGDNSGSDESGSTSNSGDGSDSSDSGRDSGSGSESESASSSKKGKKKKSKKNKKNGAKEEEYADDGISSIYKIKQISSKLSYLLDDLHKTFKPKSVPQIDPNTVFPYPCTSLLPPYVYKKIPQDSPKSKYDHLRNRNTETNELLQEPLKSPISSPIRHGNQVDQGAGGNYIFPSYAEPPSKNEIKKLYNNYSDSEKRQIAQ